MHSRRMHTVHGSGHLVCVCVGGAACLPGGVCVCLRTCTGVSAQTPPYTARTAHYITPLPPPQGL